MTDLPTRYSPLDVEGAIYERWLAADVFAPDGAGSTAGARVSTMAVAPLRNQIAPLVQRTTGVVVPPAGSATGAAALIAPGRIRCPLDALSGVGRRGSRVTFAPIDAVRLAPSRTRSGPIPALLLSVLAVRAGV